MNVTPLIRQLKIVNKKLETVPLVPNWAQLEFLDAFHSQYNAGRPVRIIVLKARQLGISTITQALDFSLSFVIPGLRSLTVAHESVPSQNLLAMAQNFWNTFNYKDLYETRFDSQKALAWTNGSTIKITTARNVGSARSSTVHFLHASEVAFWPKPSETMLAMRQAIPNTPNSFIILESTANGVGNFFHQRWIEAEAGENEYIPLFFPWHRHPEYLASEIGLEYSQLTNLDEDEKALRAMGVSDDRLSWRRWAIRNLAENDINKFKQEYPSTPEEAFIQSGTNVFSLPDLRQCYKPLAGHKGRLILDEGTGRISFRDDIAGPLKIFKNPSRDADWGNYLIGGDPTRVGNGDYACAQVINRRTLEQVAVWRGKTDPQSFADVLATLGKYYGMALLVPEMTGAGYATIGRLTGLGYPNIYQHTRPESTRGRPQEVWGWDTTAKSKPLAIGILNKLVVDHRIVIHDSETFKEMSNYVVLDSGQYGPGDAADYDDTVTSLAIGAAAHMLEITSSPTIYSGGRFSPYEDQPSVAEMLEEVENLPSWENWGENAEI